MQDSGPEAQAHQRALQKRLAETKITTGRYYPSDAPQRDCSGFDFELTYYLSGPMTGYPEHNFPVLAAAAQVLRNTGIKLISPHELCGTVDHVEAAKTYGLDYLKNDLAFMVQHTHGLILMKGWPRSRGARAELSVALELEYPVWFYDNYKLTEM